MVLARFFGEQRSGYYVDVGAHHPYRYSNTQLFYERGWTGINIDAQPGSMKGFRRYRPRDINLEIGIGKEADKAKFFVFNDTLLNTFDEETANIRNVPPFRIVETIEVPVRPLASVFDEYLPKGTTIDFLSVDAESRDLDVLASNDWTRYRPRVVMAEAFGKSIGDLPTEPTALFLTAQGYRPFAKTVNTFMYVDGDQPSQGLKFSR